MFPPEQKGRRASHTRERSTRAQFVSPAVPGQTKGAHSRNKRPPRWRRPAIGPGPPPRPGSLTCSTYGRGTGSNELLFTRRDVDDSPADTRAGRVESQFRQWRDRHSFWRTCALCRTYRAAAVLAVVEAVTVATVWCGVVWVWCGVMWCSVMWSGMVWSGVV